MKIPDGKIEFNRIFVISFVFDDLQPSALLIGIFMRGRNFISMQLEFASKILKWSIVHVSKRKSVALSWKLLRSGFGVRWH